MYMVTDSGDRHEGKIIHIEFFYEGIFITFWVSCLHVGHLLHVKWGVGHLLKVPYRVYPLPWYLYKVPFRVRVLEGDRQPHGVTNTTIGLSVVSITLLPLRVPLEVRG